MNIEILNSIHGGVVLSINNYLYKKNKDYIRKIDDKHIFYWTCVKQCGAKIRTFCENNVHYIEKNCIFSENDHLHGADPISVGAKQIKETIKKMLNKIEINQYKYTTLQSLERLKQLIRMSEKKRLDKLLNVKDVMMIFI